MKSVLFVGIEATPQCWYRCALPARALGQDWVGVSSEMQVVTGEVDGEPKVPEVGSYDVLVLQQPAGPAWLERIQALRAEGIRVLYETDDYLHGVREIADHVWQGYFTSKQMKMYDACMEACDATIVSTKFLLERYRKMSHGRIHLCLNGIDPPRYDFHRRGRDYVTVGWAGATGHIKPLVDWMNGGIFEEIRKRPSVKFCTVGMPAVAAEVAESLGDPGRCTGIPWSAFDTYPAAMTNIDIFLAPAGESRWARGKSDLRWLEASALGIPCICDARAYPQARLKAESPERAARILGGLLKDPDNARRTGHKERTRVLLHRSFPGAAEQWREVLGI